MQTTVPGTKVRMQTVEEIEARAKAVEAHRAALHRRAIAQAFMDEIQAYKDREPRLDALRRLFSRLDSTLADDERVAAVLFEDVEEQVRRAQAELARLGVEQTEPELRAVDDLMSPAERGRRWLSGFFYKNR